MFNRRKYKLTFRKTYHFKDFGSWTNIRDSALLETLLKLQQMYDFDIVQTKFGDCFSDSCIIIKCNKKDKCDIFSAYCLALRGEIEKISY